MTEASPGRLFILSGPSGVGKSTVIQNVLRARPDIYFSVSYTTRSPRPGDTEGVTYHFVDDEEFERMIRAGELLEYAGYAGHYYGTSGRLTDEHLQSGRDVLLDIEVVGAKIVREKRPDTVMIFIAPPSLGELSRRLHTRGTDPEDVVQRRLKRAEEELTEMSRYDYLVVNDTVDRAAEDILSILRAEKCRTELQISRVKERLS